MSILVSCFEEIVEAAWEGYRNCESDAKDGVEGAAATMKKYGDALDPKKLVAIKRALRVYEKKHLKLI